MKTTRALAITLLVLGSVTISLQSVHAFRLSSYFSRGYVGQAERGRNVLHFSSGTTVVSQAGNIAHLSTGQVVTLRDSNKRLVIFGTRGFVLDSRQLQPLRNSDLLSVQSGVEEAGMSGPNTMPAGMSGPNTMGGP